MQREKILDILDELANEAAKYFTGSGPDGNSLAQELVVQSAAQGYWAGMDTAEILLSDDRENVLKRKALLDDGASDVVFDILSGIALEMDV